MKKSYYNFLFEGNDGQSVLYNSRSGAMAELDADSAEQYASLTEAELEMKNPELAEALLANGFAVDDNVSELDMIRYDMLRTRFGNQELKITVALTMECNFGCVYCYEKEVIKEKYISNVVKSAIVQYVDENIIPNRELQVLWYGGEPLLDLGALCELTECFKQICEKKNVKYKAQIITNGYLLSEEVAAALLRCDVKQIQITLDGDELTHNKRRPLKNGEATYQRIWENILNLKSFAGQLSIALRVNIDKQNRNALRDIQERIKMAGLDKYVYVYPGMVVSSEICHNKEICYNNREFANIEQEFMCENKEKLSGRYPRTKTINCMADDARAIVFDSQGNMYKCLMDIGKEEFCVGNIVTKGCNEQILHKYLLHDITQKKTCSKCKFLPVCMGGCIHAQFDNRKSCTEFKYNIKEYMKYIPEIMKQ